MPHRRIEITIDDNAVVTPDPVPPVTESPLSPGDQICFVNNTAFDASVLFTADIVDDSWSFLVGAVHHIRLRKGKNSRPLTIRADAPHGRCRYHVEVNDGHRVQGRYILSASEPEIIIT